MIETGLGMGADRDARSAVDAFFRSAKPSFSSALKRKEKRDDRIAELKKVEETIKGQIKVAETTGNFIVRAAGVKSRQDMLELTADLSACPGIQSAVAEQLTDLREHWMPFYDRGFPITFGPGGAPDLGIPGLSGKKFETETELERHLNALEVKKFLATYGVVGGGQGILANTSGWKATKTKS